MGHRDRPSDRTRHTPASDPVPQTRSVAPGKQPATQSLTRTSSAPVQRAAAHGATIQERTSPALTSEWNDAVFRPDLGSSSAPIQAKEAQADESAALSADDDAGGGVAPAAPAAVDATPAAPAEDADKTQFEKLITDSKFAGAFTLLKEFDQAKQKTLWEGISADQRKSMASKLSRNGSTTSAKGKALLKVLGFAAPELEVLTRLFEIRFNVKVAESLRSQAGHETGASFDAAGLKRCWEVIEELPPRHVENNAWLAYWTRYAGGGAGSGYYSTWNTSKNGLRGKKGGESALGYDPAKLDDPNKAADPGDPLYDVTRFNKVVRHEVGHAVDQKLGSSKKYCVGNKNGGNWKEHGAPNATLVNTIVAASRGAIHKWTEDADKAKRDADVAHREAKRRKNKKTAEEKADAKKAAADAGTAQTAAVDEKKKILKVLLDSMTSGQPGSVHANIDALGLDPARAAQAKADKATTTVVECGRNRSPWYNLAGLGHNLSGRHYQESYAGTWVSYEHSAVARKVSQYQFRAPGEWFAEAYATYYQPDGEGKIGTLLEARDPTTKKWFDNNVHNK